MEFLDDVVDTAVDRLFDKATDFVERVRDGQRESFTEEQLRQTYKCAGCHKLFAVQQMEMLHPSNGFGTCKTCFSFMWNAAKEKMAIFSKRAARVGAQRVAGAAQQAMPKPPTEPPWQVLGVDMHAAEADIKKAYRRLALEWHPDRWNGGSSEDKHRASQMFQKVQAAYDVMMKVRQPAEE